MYMFALGLALSKSDTILFNNTFTTTHSIVCVVNINIAGFGSISF